MNKHRHTQPAQRTGDAQGRDLALMAMDDRHFVEFDVRAFVAGGPLDATSEILTGGVRKPYTTVSGYAAFVYRDPREAV